MMIRILLAFFIVLGLGSAALAQTDDAPKFPFPVTATPAPLPATAAPQQRVLKRIDQVWRLPNGFEEYYMLLAIVTADKAWCDRMSLEAQIRKPDARPGVQVIAWRSICMIEVASLSKNQELCRFVRPTVVDALDGREFNQDYCVTQTNSVRTAYTNSGNHWLQVDPYKPNFLNAQMILQYLGFTENDLVSKQQQGLYQTVTKSTWGEFLLDRMLSPYPQNRPDPEKFDRMVSRSIAFTDYSQSSQPVDRYLRYTGTSVKLPADCYENPTAEFTCRMLECLNVRDIITCRAIGKTKEAWDLKSLFIDKCVEKNKNPAVNTQESCRMQVEPPFNKIFNGTPETFLPYLNR